MADHSDPITLANVHQYLDGDGIFLPEDDETNDQNGRQHHHADGPTDHEIDAAIHNASNSLLVHDSTSIDHGDSLIDPSLMVDAQHNASSDIKRPLGVDDSSTHLHRSAKRRMLSEDAITNPTSHLAPFIKPQRGEGTPHPEQLLFTSRTEFETWLAGESSWCHYVQRRVTNPEKRADERLKARMRAHERSLACESAGLSW